MGHKLTGGRINLKRCYFHNYGIELQWTKAEFKSNGMLYAICSSVKKTGEVWDKGEGKSSKTETDKDQ